MLKPHSTHKFIKIVSLIKFIFSQLQLKGKTFVVCDAILDDEVDRFFKSLELDKELKPSDKKLDLLDRPKFSQYLKHCCHLQT